MIKYWHYKSLAEAMDQPYIDLMMLNATINTGDSTSTGGKADTGRAMSFFDFGKQLAGMN